MPIERSEEWLAAQREIDANIVAKQEAARANEGKSLFETLQANKGMFLESPLRPLHLPREAIKGRFLLWGVGPGTKFAFALGSNLGCSCSYGYILS